MAEKNHITPVIPGLIDEARVIQYYVTHACDVPWIVYLEALKPWAHDLAVMLLALDLGDLVKQFFRPKGLRSERHGRRGNKGGRKRGGIPDITEMVADEIYIDEVGNHKAFYGTRSALIIGTELVDRVVFEAFLGEQVEKGLLAPIMGALRFDRTKCPDYTYLNREYTGGMYGLPNTDWVAFGFGDYVASNRVHSPNGFTCMPLVGQCLAVWGGTFYNDNTTAEDIGIRIVESGGGPVLAEQGPQHVEAGASFDFCISCKVNELQGITGQVKENGGGFRIGGTYFCLFQIGD